MLEAGTRRRKQPPPPAVVFAALTDPAADPVRPWLHLLDDEHPPQILHAAPDVVVWSSLWPKRPDARIRFDLASDGAGGTDLRWTLHVEEPLPDPSLLGHLRKRLNHLVNADLRATFDQ
ncbi:hypothetical protein [Nucisporomicrobium flavum]|jgi:hypothetical protein|uniref:hypothetical protein n=1 Tax=Nucisporomicrobium flavum TaxID=2785915 RepID=UPI0018F56C4E|nr:hypothetical protein [Nucisporomicrobium flavum]